MTPNQHPERILRCIVMLMDLLPPDYDWRVAIGESEPAAMALAAERRRQLMARIREENDELRLRIADVAREMRTADLPLDVPCLEIQVLQWADQLEGKGDAGRRPQ